MEEDEEVEIQEMHDDDDEDEQSLSSSDGASESDDEQKVQYECEVIENIYFYVPLLSGKTNRNLTFFVLKFWDINCNRLVWKFMCIVLMR